MKKLYEKIVTGGFGVTLLLLCGVRLTSYLSIQQLREDKQWLMHSGQVLENINSIDSELTRIESATYHLIFISPSVTQQASEVEKFKVYQKLTALRYLTRDNPKQQYRLNLLQLLIEREFTLFEESLKLSKNQKQDTTTQIILANRCRQVRELSWAIADAIKDEEQALLQRQTSKTDKSPYQVTLLQNLGFCLSLILLAIVYNLLQKQIRINQALSQEGIRLEQEAAKAKMVSFLESTTDAFIALDNDWCYSYVNQRAGEIFNRRPEDLVGKNIWEEFPEGIGQRFYHAYYKALAEQQMIQLEEYYPPWERWYENRIYPSQEGLSIFFQDITPRKLTEIALEKSEKRYRSLVVATSQAVWLKNSQGFPKEFSSWLALTGQTEDELKHRGWIDAIHPEDREQAAQSFSYAFATKSQYVTEHRVRVKDGTYRYFAVRAVPVLDANGEVWEWVGTHTDITERVLATQALREANEKLENKVQERTQELQLLNAELERSNQELVQFACVASHDLQEPLRAIMGYTQILEAEYQHYFDQSAHEYIHHITDGVRRMQQLIQDLLAYSRAGTVSKALTTTDCNTVLKQALSNLQVMITENKASITFDCLPRVIGDKTQLVQLFQNLIGNAIKFHSSKLPQIHIGAIRGNTGQVSTYSEDEYLFWVQDNGIGIKSEYLERIFEVFCRLHTRREFPGTGIGLAICKKIVERHNGCIWAESQLGVGTTFYFTLQGDFDVN